MNRKILTTLSIVMFLLILISCKTVKKEDPNFLGDFSPIDLGSLMAGTVKRINGEIKPTELNFIFFPRSNIVSMVNRFMGDKVETFLDQQDREVLIKAMELYIDSYSNQTLSLSNAKKKAFFGNTKVIMTWGLLGGGAHKTEPILRAEYQLLSENRPYFILANESIKAIGEQDGANCPALRIALSPAQCQDFIEFLKQENLLKIVNERQKDFEKFEPEKKTEMQENLVKPDGINYGGF